jgi:hypothetical protein
MVAPPGTSPEKGRIAMTMRTTTLAASVPSPSPSPDPWELLTGLAGDLGRPIPARLRRFAEDLFGSDQSDPRRDSDRPASG